jgi:hypothetical protein
MHAVTELIPVEYALGTPHTYSARQDQEVQEEGIHEHVFHQHENSYT